MSKNLSRRDLLKATAVGAVGMTAAGQALASTTPEAVAATPQRRNASDRPRFAMVGVAGRGAAHLGPAREHGEIVAICDIDANSRAKAVVEDPYAIAFVDFRKMLEHMGDSIDAVVISTPDHTHAPAAAMAMKMGKAVYCEKPMTRSVYEARRLTELARRHRVATQMGNQGTSDDMLRRSVSLLKSGRLGAVKEIHCWTNRPAGWWAHGVPRPESKPIPRHVAWDEWVGPAPYRPYADGYHAFAWRGFWDFGTGSLGDIGCHCMNMPYLAFDLRDPIAVSALTSGNNKESFPLWSVVTYEFPKRGNRPAVNLVWYDGGKLPPQDLAPGVEKLDANGCLVVCENGTLYAAGEYGGQGRVLGSSIDLMSVEFEKSPGHFAEWVEAIKGGKAAGSNFDIAGPLTETVLMGNLAVWAEGERIEWDARRMAVKGGRDEFNEIIRPEYRSGWEL